MSAEGAEAEFCPSCGPGYRYGAEGCRHLPTAEGAEATGGEGVRLSEAEVRMYERIEDSGDTQGLAWRVQETVRAHVAARVQQAEEHAIECERIGVKAIEDRIMAEAERDALRDRVEALLPDECLITRNEWRCTAMIGAGFPNQAKFTEDMCCTYCRIRAALDGAA